MRKSCAEQDWQDAESAAAIERAKDRMSVASVRREGTGNPDPRKTSDSLGATHSPAAASAAGRVTAPA
jgi:hypothetical protein